MITRRMFNVGLASVGLTAAAAGARSVRAAETLKIGVLTDMSGVLSSVLGTGSVDGARLAIEDYGSSVAGMPIELVFGDHQNKPDIASTTALKWIDEENVDLILDLGQSACALAVKNIATEKNKIVIVTGASSSDITGKYCDSNSFHWGYDTFMQSAALAGELTRQGGDTWFFLTADYAFGHRLEADASTGIVANGGKVVGSVRHPVNTQDFSSFLLQAQASGATMIGIASAGDDLERVMRQGAEFGIWEQQKAAAFGLQLFNVPVIGIDVMTGVLHNSIFYWDRNEETRAFGRRFWERNGKPPAETHAVNYSAVTHYLNAVKAANSKETGAVLAKIRELPVSDVVTPSGTVRADGRLIRPTFLVEVKKAEDVKETFDCLTVVSEIPGDQAFRPVASSECPLLKS